MNILVTGSNGMIGTRLCEVLLEKKHKVFGVDIIQNKYSSKVDKLTTSLDLLNRKDVLSSLPKKIDYVIHLAAYSRVMQTIVQPQQAIQNVEMLKNVMDYCLQEKVSGIVFSSSREVYGNIESTSCSESDLGHAVENPYGASKLACEAMLQAYSTCYGLRYVTLRFSNIYGKYDEGERVIPYFMNLIHSGKNVEIYGKNKTLDFTYIDDAVQGIMLAVEKFSSVPNMSFNIASGNGVELATLAKQIAIALKKNLKIVYKANRPGEVMRYVAEISKAKMELGYEPNYSIEMGLMKSVDWYRSLFLH